MVLSRLVISLCNIFCPPVAVMLMTGLHEDFILNCCFFLLAVFPSHIHSFYISLTYFIRKRRVKKGIYPGKPMPLIFSDKINNGGATRREVVLLKKAADEKEEEKLRKKQHGKGKQTNVGRRRSSRRRSSRLDSSSSDNYNGSVDNNININGGVNDPGSSSPEITRINSRRQSRRYDVGDDNLYAGQDLSRRSSRRQ